MPIVFCSLELYLPYCHSLKEKRSILRKTSDRLRSRFNFSVSEIDHQDSWQRARLAAVAVGPSGPVLEQAARKLVEESERILGGDLVRCEIDFLDHD